MTTIQGDSHNNLIAEFVASFAKLDEMMVIPDIDPVADELTVGDCDEVGFQRWQPIEHYTSRTALESVNAKLPGRLPPLYESLILSHRWAQVDLGSFRLLANPPGEGLTGLEREMSKDPVLWNFLIKAGYIRFGMGPDMDYDPVCFDLKSRKKGGDCRIVKIDHEEILCRNRLTEVAELAPTFESLVRQIITSARDSPSKGA